MVSLPTNPLEEFEEQLVEILPLNAVNIEPTNESSIETMGESKFSRIRKLAIFSDYMVYLWESYFDVGLDTDLSSFLRSHERRKV